MTFLPILAAFYLTRDGEPDRRRGQMSIRFQGGRRWIPSMLIGSRFEAGTGNAESRSSTRAPAQRSSNIAGGARGADRRGGRRRRESLRHLVADHARRSARPICCKIARAIEAEAEEFAALEALNCGKPINAVLNDEIPAIVDCYRFFAGAVRSMPGQVAGEYLAGHTSMVRRDPIGIVASIAPWNYPLMMMAWKLGAGDRRRQHRRVQAVRADAARPR